MSTLSSLKLPTADFQTKVQGLCLADSPSLHTAKESKHRKDIDGLRAVAVLAVLGFHCGVPGFSGGFVGVDVFFAISGYLICGILTRDLELKAFSIKEFYKRRCRRILPALFAVLTFCLTVGLLVLSPSETRHLGESAAATVLSLANVDSYLKGGYFRAGLSNPLLMTWSLAVEEQFYLAFPLLMVLLFKRSKRHLLVTLAVLCTCSLLLSIYAEFHYPEFNFYLPFTRSWEIGAGALLALWQARKSPRRTVPSWSAEWIGNCGLLIILGCVSLYSSHVRFPGYEAIPPVLGTILLLGVRRSRATRLLSLRPFVAVGLISYSLYLWHWPILSFASIVASTPTSAATRAVLMAIAFVAATLSYHFIEKPFRYRKNATADRVLLGYASATACFLTVCAILFLTQGLPARYPVLASVEGSLDLDRHHVCLSVGHSFRAERECVPPISETPALALLGDSHAEALQKELGTFATDHGYKLLTLTKTVCPPMQGITRSRIDLPQHAAACADFNRAVLNVITSRPDVRAVVLTGSWAFAEKDRFLPVAYRGDVSSMSQQQSERYLMDGLRAEVKALEAAGKKVIVVDDVPSLRSSPIDGYKYALLPARRYLAKLLDGLPPDSIDRSIRRTANISPEAETARKDLLALAKSDPQLTFVDSKGILCSSAECFASDGSHLYYSDNNHVSNFGAALLVAHLNLHTISQKP